MEVDHLFRPRLIDANVTRNNITVGWYDVHDAVHYTLQAAFTADMSDPFFDEEINFTVFTFSDLPYATRVYFRMRANAAHPEHSSPWVTFDATTEVRITPIILHSIDKTNIYEEQVYLTWNIDEQNPVDSIGLSPMDAASTAPEVGRYLTPTELSEGAAWITGLDKNTAYRVNIFDTSKPGIYDKSYNEVTFRTAGPPAGAIHIGPDDHLGQLLSENDKDPDIPEGTTYYLEAGTAYEMTGLTLTKGLRIVAAPGIRPRITLTSNFFFSGMLSEFYIEGIDWINPTAQNYFVNNVGTGATYTIDEFSLVDCRFTGFDRGFIRTQASGDKVFRNILIDDCVFNIVETFAYGGYGFLIMASSTDRVEKYTVTNSTFYNSCKLGRGLMEATSELGEMEITVSNCTFYDSFAGSLLYVPYLGGGHITVTNNLFAGPLTRTGIYNIPSAIPSTVNKNYFTADAKQGNYPLPTAPIILTESSEDLFADPEGADFTLIDKESEAYTEWIGDPRWIK